MQIVSRRTMLALPVERLVGSSTSNNNNNSNENNNRRPTMSPDSSGSSNISDSSGSSARSDSPNAKVYSSYMSNNNNNNNTSTKSDNSINKYSPIRAQSISPTTAASSPPLTPPAVISSTSDQAEDSTGNSKFRCSCNGNGEEPSRNINTGRPVVGGYGMTLSSPSSSGQEEIQFKTENNNNNNNRNEDEEMDDDRKEEGNNHPEPSATNAIPLLVQSSKKIRIIENDSLNKMDNMDSMSSSGDDEIENNATRPPSRPPSSASSNFTTASTNTTFPLSPNSDIKPIPMISRPQHHHHHHHNNGSLQALKFSIEDILRPEFGKSAVIKTRPPSSNSNRRCNSIVDFLPDSPSSIRSKESLSNNHRNNNDYGQQVSPRQNYHHRPSSIKDHSEDSNSSCTSRKEEVVDESKVNPPVPAGPLLWPAWVYCTRYSDRPSSGKITFLFRPILKKVQYIQLAKHITHTYIQPPKLIQNCLAIIWSP